MKDPCTLAFEIYLGRKQKKDGNYRSPLVTIWHKDPCKDGTDDSCGWFIRPRHADQKVLSDIEKEFSFNYENNYWFNKEGKQIFSTVGTLMLMYRCAAWEHFKHSRKKADAFMRKYCADIINFAENPVDCAGDEITGKFYGPDLLNKDRLTGMASMIYADILRKERKWYQHPKWHILHWRFDFPIFREFWVKYFKTCSICKKVGYETTYGYTDWGGKKSWCSKCEENIAPKTQSA